MAIIGNIPYFQTNPFLLLEATNAAQLAHQNQTTEPVEADMRAKRIKDLIAVINLGQLMGFNQQWWDNHGI